MGNLEVGRIVGPHSRYYAGDHVFISMYCTCMYTRKSRLTIVRQVVTLTLNSSRLKNSTVSSMGEEGDNRSSVGNGSRNIGSCKSKGTNTALVTSYIT